MAYNTDVSSAVGAVAVTASDSTTFAATKGILLGTGGTIYVDMAKRGTNVKLVLAGGIIHPLQVTRVYATGLSSAADIVAFY
jgi:hypothetical protein